MEEKSVAVVEQPGMALDAVTEQSMQRSIEAAERYLGIIDRIRKVALRLTNVRDWSDQGGNPYLEKSGCDKIACGFGIQVDSPIIEKEACTDDRGDYIIYTIKGTGRWNNNVASEIGTCSTRDDFFALRRENGEKKLLPLSEIDLCDIKRKAHTNFMNRLIKRLLGLSFTWEEIGTATDNKITREAVAGAGRGVSFDRGSKGGAQAVSADGAKIKAALRQMILDMADGEQGQAKAMLVTLTAFTGKDGKEIPGKSTVDQLSEKALHVTYGKAKTKYIKWLSELPDDMKGIASFSLQGDDLVEKPKTGNGANAPEGGTK